VEQGCSNHAEQAPGEAGVMRASQSLAAQLVSRHRLEPYASRDTLSPALASAPDFLERLLSQAAEHLTAGEKLVIVVDALDEAGLGSNMRLPVWAGRRAMWTPWMRPASVPTATCWG
jgi:hypothetical protein